MTSVAEALKDSIGLIRAVLSDPDRSLDEISNWFGKPVRGSNGRPGTIQGFILDLSNPEAEVQVHILFEDFNNNKSYTNTTSYSALTAVTLVEE